MPKNTTEVKTLVEEVLRTLPQPYPETISSMSSRRSTQRRILKNVT